MNRVHNVSSTKYGSKQFNQIPHRYLDQGLIVVDERGWAVGHKPVIQIIGAKDKHVKGRSKRGWTSEPVITADAKQMVSDLITWDYKDHQIANALELPRKFVRKLISQHAAERKAAKEKAKQARIEHSQLYHAWLEKFDLFHTAEALKTFNLKRARWAAEVRGKTELQSLPVPTWDQWVEEHVAESA